MQDKEEEEGKQTTRKHPILTFFHHFQTKMENIHSFLCFRQTCFQLFYFHQQTALSARFITYSLCSHTPRVNPCPLHLSVQQGEELCPSLPGVQGAKSPPKHLSTGTTGATSGSKTDKTLNDATRSSYGTADH